MKKTKPKTEKEKSLLREERKKPTKAEIEKHFSEKEIFEKVNKILKEADIDALGVSLQGLQIRRIIPEARGFCCVRRVPKMVGGVLKNVCVDWSDGIDHSNDPDVADC